MQDNPWVLYVDGSSSIRVSGLGVVLHHHRGCKTIHSIRCDFKATTNEAEYEALVAGMSIAWELVATTLHVKNDSLHVVNQMNEEFTTKD